MVASTRIINHVKALVDVCKQEGLTNVFVHAFTDGRDTDPKSGLGLITDLQKSFKSFRWKNCNR